MNGKLEVKALRVGRINYVNTTPFYYGLFGPEERVCVTEGSPAEMNALMRNDQLDFAPISSLEYALHQDKYYLFPDLCIGSRDFSRSVLLFSKERIEGLNEETIVLSQKSLSSQTLLKILLKFRYQFKNHFITGRGLPEEMLEQGKAALAIGDDALFYKPKEFLFKYDLSELWWDWKQLPFCFSVLAVQRKFYEEWPKETFRFYRRLKENTEKNLQDLESLIRDSLDITLADNRFATVFGYLFNLNYHFDAEMLQGLELFYEYAHEAGFIPKVNGIRFLEVPS